MKKEKDFARSGFGLTGKAITIKVCFLLLFASVQFAPVNAHPLNGDISSLSVAGSPTNNPLVDIKGKVSDDKGSPVSGASVSIKGSSRGTITDATGHFSIAAQEKDVLVISAVGFLSETVTVGKIQDITIVLQNVYQQLSEVVVTALGVKRANRSVGYSIAELKASDLSAGREANLANELSGKVAGVMVSRAASGAGGSSKVVIRGLNSLQGNSQPLYVVDGVPLNNGNLDPAGRGGGTDYGDGISNIDPNDVENVSILKGPNAAALYGQQGANGVVLITTKSGKSRKGLGIRVSSDYAIGNAAVVPDFQDVYGQGLNGKFTHFRNSADAKIYGYDAAITAGYAGVAKTSAGRDRLTRGSWGPQMTGQDYEDQWGTKGKFLAQPNTFQAFFDTEMQATNSINLDGGNDNVNYYFSYSNFNSKGYVPTNKINRNTFSARTVAKILPKMTLDVKLSYVGQTGNNRPTLSGASDNPAYLFISQPRSISMKTLESYFWTAPDIAGQLGYSSARTILGVEKTYATNSSTANPYWTINRTGNNDKRDRILAMANLDYEILPWLKAAMRVGTDFYSEQRLRYSSKLTYASPNLNGDMSETVTRIKDDYADALLTGSFDLTSDLKLSLNAGANYQKKFLRTVGNSGSEFVVPDLVSIGNTLTKLPIFELNESEIQSLYGFGQFAYKNYLYLDFSARNDWSSTLSPENNSFFYPSISTSFIASDAFKITSKTLSFLKLRSSLAQAGSSGFPYQTKGTFTLGVNTLSGQPLGGYTNVIVSPDLKNELTTSFEAGLDARFFDNKISLVATYYHASTKNQILDVPLPISTTFATKRLNAGNIENQGIELSLSGTLIKTNSGFRWDVTFNYAANKNNVLSLYPGISTFRLGDDRNIAVVAEVGKPFGALIGTNFAWQRDASGNRLIDPATGLPIRSATPVNEYLGNSMPDWIGGLSNSFKYKSIGFSVLLDIRQGGKVFSNTLREGLTYGTITKTLEGRDGSYIAEGVVAQKDGTGKWVSTGAANAKGVTAQAYWNSVAADKDNLVSSELINDASYISVREVNLSYQLDPKLLKNTAFKKVYLGLYGRNLFYLQRFTDGFAPEAASFNVNNSSLGLESTSLPMLRNIGIRTTLEF
ncbi:MAG: SusC/RagA family TonB-linked outer membrane protein [Chitinophagaceae bacterium]|nr:SusC/RagA family TonB-linked outer membrane protein [Chitinophagaceae bacterium]